MDAFLSTEATRIIRHTDVSQYPRYSSLGPNASDYNAEYTAVNSRIPPWILPPEETQALHDRGLGLSPKLIYARGVPYTPDSGQASFNKKLCTLILREIGFSRDLGCEKKRTEKTEKYSPLDEALKQYWGRVELVAFTIGLTGTTLTRTLDHLTAAFYIIRPRVNNTSAIKGTSQPSKDSKTTSHDYRMFKSLLDALTDLSQSRLLGISKNMKRLVEALPGATRRNRAHSAATPTHTQAATQQGVATHRHRTRTTRVPESTAIT